MLPFSYSFPALLTPFLTPPPPSASLAFFFRTILYQIRTGVRPEKFNEQLRPATFLVANRGNVDLTVQNPGAAPSSPTSAAAMAPNANNGGNFNGFSGSSNNSSGTSSGVPLVAATAVHGNQRGENWQQLGQTGWVPEANVLLDRTQGPNPNRAEGVDPTLYKDAMTEAQQNSGGSDGTALNPIWGEQFTVVNIKEGRGGSFFLLKHMYCFFFKVRVGASKFCPTS